MLECSDVDFLPKSGQTCSCRLVNAHNVATYGAFDKRHHHKIVTTIGSLTKKWTLLTDTFRTKNRGGR